MTNAERALRIAFHIHGWPTSEARDYIASVLDAKDAEREAAVKDMRERAARDAETFYRHAEADQFNKGDDPDYVRAETEKCIARSIRALDPSAVCVERRTA